LYQSIYPCGLFGSSLFYGGLNLLTEDNKMNDKLRGTIQLLLTRAELTTIVNALLNNTLNMFENSSVDPLVSSLLLDKLNEAVEDLDFTEYKGIKNDEE
tara:strand:+ start:34470 stop:34766 length:297 start_codon:yes stop_codon:yes gene_type:complete